MQPDAPRVADEGTEADTSEALAHSGIAADRERGARTAPNVAQSPSLSRGDLAQGFAESDFVLEKTYHVPMVHQGYIETHAAPSPTWTDRPDHDLGQHPGLVQHPRRDRRVLSIPETQIKVIPMECGGGFGAKIRALVEPITVLLPQATGRPVKYVMTRREELEAGMPAPQRDDQAEDRRQAGRHAAGARGARRSSRPAPSPGRS